MYYYGPCTRALAQFMMCRELGGAGVDAHDPEPRYQTEYLKHDMQYPCQGDEHRPVVIAAGILWLLYAVCFPMSIVCVIAKHKWRHVDGAEADFWSSTLPKAEKFWYPIVAHLQVLLVVH